MKHSEVYKRLFIIYTTVLLVSVISLDVYFIYYSKKDVRLQKLYLNEKMIEDIELELIKQTNASERIINGIYNQEFIAEDIINILNNDLTTYLKLKLDYLTDSEVVFYNGIEKYIDQTFSQYKEIINIELVSYSRQQSLKFSPNGTLRTEVLDKYFVENLQKKNIISEQDKISHIKEVTNPNDLKKEGLIIITYNTDNIKKITESYGYESLIVDQYGEVAYDSDEGYDQEKLLEYVESPGLVPQSQIKLDNRNYYVNILIDKLGNVILGRVDSFKINSLPIKYYITLFLIDLVVILAAVFIIYVKLMSLSNRMNKIVHAMEQVKSGDLDVKIDFSDQKDELSFIAEQFNNMCVDLKNYIDISYLAEMNKKEAELSKKRAEMSALQSKINPHFLYNTLESIRMKAICKGNREVARMLYLLANLFRSQLKEDDIITIEKEVKYCREYLELFKFRYDDKFNYYIDCEEELLNQKVIKFILQPIIENYIVHGIRREDYDNEISIKIFRKDQSISIIVVDNGYGIKLEKIKEINKKLKTKDFQGKSIGIINTHERIILQYGDLYGVKIDEDFKCGTRIILNIPMGECENV